jgi:hypothetical protein
MSTPNFTILNFSEINKIDFSLIYEDSPYSLRYSNDGQKLFITWNGETPKFVNDLITKEGIYTYAEILEILNTSEWI